MWKQLLFELWDDPGRASLWESFPGDDRDRAIALLTRLAIRAVHAQPEHGTDESRDDLNNRRRRDDRHT